MEAVINKKGRPVLLNSPSKGYSIDESNLTFDLFGYLHSFKMNSETFIYLEGGTNLLLFKDNHNTLVPGYYSENSYAAYLNGGNTFEEFANLSHFYDWEFAPKGMIVQLKFLYFEALNYYTEQVYEFKVNYDTNGKPKNYYKPPELLISDVGNDDYCVLLSDIVVDRGAEFDNLFYMKHATSGDGAFLGWNNPSFNAKNSEITAMRGQCLAKLPSPFGNQCIDFDIISLTTFNKLMTVICFRMFYVYRDAIDAFTINSKAHILECAKQKFYFGNPTLYEALPVSDKVIATIFHEWGVVFSEVENQWIVSLDFPKVLNTHNPQFGGAYEYTWMYNFQVGLNHVYNNFRYLNDAEQIYTASYGANPNPFYGLSQPVQKLLNLFLLHPNSHEMISFLGSESRLQVMDVLIRINKGDLSYRIQEIVIAILGSFNPLSDADQLLDYMLECRDNETTNFEIFFSALDDSRLYRYPIFDIFLESYTYKMSFVYIIYNFWKNSKFSFYNVPIGESVIDDVIFPNCYFLTNEGITYYVTTEADGTKNYVNPIIEFKTIEGNGLSNWDIEYEPKEFKREKVTINKFNREVNKHSGKKGKKSNEVDLKFHLYQSLTMINYDNYSLDLSIPDSEPIPAFLFYYLHDYTKLKQFDASLAFAINLTMEVGFFLAFGGLTNLRHIVYLRHVTALRNWSIVGNSVNVVGNPQLATLTWAGLESGFMTVSLTSAGVSSWYNYVIQAADNSMSPEELERANDMRALFAYIAIGTGLGASLARYKAVLTAKKVLSNLPSPGQIPIPNGLLDVLQTLNSNYQNFVTRVSSISDSIIGETSHIPSVYNSLNDTQKLIFYQHFGRFVPHSEGFWAVSHKAFWKEMNQTMDNIPAARMQAWKLSLYEYHMFISDIEYLRKLHIIFYSTELNTEVFIGRIWKELKVGANPNSTNHIDFVWNTKGIHHKNGLQSTGEGGLGRIVGQPIPVGPPGLGFYDAKLELYHPDFPNNNGWKVKPAKQGKSSSFFPDSWSKEKLQHELAIALDNKTYQYSNIYHGTMANGVKVQFHIDGSIIQTAFPIF